MTRITAAPTTLQGELTAEHSRLTNQLREQLWRYYVQLLTLRPRFVTVFREHHQRGLFVNGP